MVTIKLSFLLIGSVTCQNMWGEGDQQSSIYIVGEHHDSPLWSFQRDMKTVKCILLGYSIKYPYLPWQMGSTPFSDILEQLNLICS